MPAGLVSFTHALHDNGNQGPRPKAPYGIFIPAGPQSVTVARPPQRSLLFADNAQAGDCSQLAG